MKLYEQRRKLIERHVEEKSSNNSSFANSKSHDNKKHGDQSSTMRIRQTSTKYHRLFPRTTINSIVIIKPKSVKTTIRHLPPEIMLCIFELLPTRNEIYTCLFVCKSWNTLVLPVLYKSPQIYHRFSSTTTTTTTALDSSLDINEINEFVTDATIQTIALTCPNLRRISLNGCTHISDSSLDSLSIHHCASSLLSISLSGCRKITDTGLKMLSKSCQKFTSLNISDCGKITDKGVSAIAKGCPRLRQVRLSDCSRLTDQSIEALLFNCPRLSWLDIARIGRIQDSTIQLIADICQENLEWLNLAHKSIIMLTKKCPNLQLLDLSYLNSITNSSIESIAKNSYSLICLTIIGCRLITCDSLRYLAQLRRKSGHLGCITMGDAAGITEDDIESITNEPEGLLSGWQKSSVDENSLKEILGGISWEDASTW
ncbi:9565_t:CDS:2 [Diversispora eburnea]|uniref:9565_t:CDS:1 n=1 Tax=Diversispora eburnea TaxID=1213867 RepID=A0A9N8YJS9_9GLOM|nr:9565_t:CDS:2 [Diversispora eburnea]